MRSEFYSEHGFIGNCDEGLTIPYAYTELVRKAEEGDKTAVYKMEAIVRHSDNEEVKAYISGQLPRIYEMFGLGAVQEEVEGDDNTGDTEEPSDPEDSETPVDPGDSGSGDGSDGDDVIYDGGALSL